MLAVLAVDVEQRPVPGNATGADTKHEAALREVVEVGHPVGQLDRMVIGQQMCAGSELDVLGAQQCLSQQQVGRADRLPRHREVLTNPGLHVAELVGQRDQFEVPLGRVVQAALRWMRRHQEYSDLHLEPSPVVVEQAHLIRRLRLTTQY